MRKRRLSIKKSPFKKQIREFIKNGGRVTKLPNEVEWDMFPFRDSYGIRFIGEKGILDYEESRKPVGETSFKDE